VNIRKNQKRGLTKVNGSTTNTVTNPRTNNPLNKAAGIGALSSKIFRDQSQELRRKIKQHQCGGRPDDLRPAYINIPETTIENQAQDHQLNQFH